MKNFKEKSERGESGFLNRNCWLVKNLNSAPYRRCKYCDFKFRNCLFLHYQIISLGIIILFLVLIFLIEGRVSTLVIISIFAQVIIYGYFFNQSTEKIIKANFDQRKAKLALEELTEKLEERVDKQTKVIQKKADHLEKLLKMRSEFLDIASHQLRTPTSVIKGTLAMMKDGDIKNLPPEEQTKFVENMFLKAVKLENIINDILVASEIDTADFSISLNDKIELDKLVEKIVDEHQFDAKTKKLKLSFKKLAGEALKIKGNIKYLEQAITIFIDNALKYTFKGEVKVTIEKKDNNAIIKVVDTGIGIPKPDLSRIFHKFIRAKNATKTYTDGSGLGLFIVKEVMDQHPNSKVWVESEENKGSIFNLQLPLEK